MFEISWQFVAVVVAIISLFSGVVLLAVRFMLMGHRDHVEITITNFAQVVTTGNEQVKQLERDVIDLKIKLPEHYVRREDWIRFASVIDAKQDALGDKVAMTNEKFERLLERMKIQ